VKGIQDGGGVNTVVSGGVEIETLDIFWTGEIVRGSLDYIDSALMSRCEKFLKGCYTCLSQVNIIAARVHRTMLMGD